MVGNAIGTDPTGTLRLGNVFNGVLVDNAPENLIGGPGDGLGNLISANGSSGIAVGMASSMPPHNIREICDAIVAVIDDPAIELERLMEIVPGPDFPTGGVVKGRQGIIEAYGTGRGRVVVRGKFHHTRVSRRTAAVRELHVPINSPVARR